MFQLVFDRTPFYAEMGGQIGDTGYIESESGERINILNTVKENNLTIHIAERIPSDCTESFSLHVDAERRLKITNNHTTTHLLDQALREVLGTHVEQKGSYVCPDYLRFDFSHFSKMTDEEIEKWRRGSMNLSVPTILSKRRETRQWRRLPRWEPSHCSAKVWRQGESREVRQVSRALRRYTCPGDRSDRHVHHPFRGCSCCRRETYRGSYR